MLLLLAACAGQSSAPDSAAPRSGAYTAPGDTEDTDYFELKSGERISVADSYRRLEQSPGVPGVDYDPARIMLSYLDNAPALKGSSAVPGAGGAAAHGSSLVKQNAQYLAWTDRVAGKYGLEIGNQVYVEDNNFATFITKDGSDAGSLILALRADSELAPALAHVFHEPLRQASYVPNDPFYLSSNSGGGNGGQWSLHKMGAATAWDFTRGDPSVTVAVVDTGVRTSHEELSRACYTSADFPGEKLGVINNNTVITDDDGHGTFIAGIIGAQGNNNRTITGIAPDVKILPVKIANGGSAPLGAIIDGCYLAFNLGAQVVNLSWGSYGGVVNEERAMVNFIWNNGGLFVCAAGNDNTANTHYPDGYANAFSVGSTHVGSNDARAGFSNFGSYVDIAAPGDALRSCKHTSDTAYEYPSMGTSFSAPLVAGAAALMWSFSDSLTNQEIRDLIVATGKPTTGFDSGNPVKRIDLPSIFAELSAEAILLPLQDKLTMSGSATISVQVAGNPASVSLYVDNELAETLSSAPWDFDVDFSSYLFRRVNLRFETVIEGQPVSNEMNVIVDNSAPTFPVQEGFEEQERSFYAADFRRYSDALVEAVKQLDTRKWSLGEVRSGGGATWHDETGTPVTGVNVQHLFDDFQVYGAHETDALISRRISFSGVSDPTVVFRHRFNIENAGSGKDRAWVLVTDDEGLTFSPGKLKTVGTDSYYSGYLPSWSKAAVDLSEFAGKTVRVVLLFESDLNGVGEDVSQDIGWWVDDITVGRTYQEEFPSIDGVDFAAGSSVGLAPDLQQFSVSVMNPQDVSKVRYWLDVAPFGELIPGLDTIVDVESGAEFSGLIMVPGLPNQTAQLSVYVYDAIGNQGPVTSIPCYIFNLPGDANLDNKVDLADQLLIRSRNGLQDSSPGYVPFYDSNLDGIVNEVDLSAVGYFWGHSI